MKDNYHELINKYNYKNKDKAIRSNYVTTNIQIIYATLEPLKQRHETDFGIDIKINQMMQYTSYLKEKYQID